MENPYIIKYDAASFYSCPITHHHHPRCESCAMKFDCKTHNDIIKAQMVLQNKNNKIQG